MVNPEKVRLMTKAAIFEKAEAQKTIQIVSYRRKDYILSRMLLVLLSATVGYFIIVGGLLFMIVMAYESIVLNTRQMILVIIAVLFFYAVVLIFYYMLSHKIYGERHVKARRDVRRYLLTMKKLQAMTEEGNGK